MLTAALAEYLAEIREQVCSRCPERPAEGPPCEPLGKICGVELHLQKIIDVVHKTESASIQPYLTIIGEHVCAHCENLHEEGCPCPMDSLSVLLVEAIETVDQRHL